MATKAKAPAKKAKKAIVPPGTAMEAYKALQKSLQIKVAVDEDDAVIVGPDVVDFLGPGQGLLLRAAIEFAFAELSILEKVPLISRVTGKTYFAFKRATEKETFLSRPVNDALFRDDLQPVRDLCALLESGLDTPGLSAALRAWPADQLNKTLYSMAMTFCCAIDVQKSGDRKTPGTFFEYFVAYLFAQRLRVNPRRRVEVTSAGHKIMIPTDFIFDPGPLKRKFHVPVKTSTRERVIQVWAHQRVIDGTLGQGRYLGTPVIMTETKLDKKKLDVIEICLPEQWQIYQGHIAPLARIYYLDLPAPYVALNDVMPPIVVKPLAEFFYEADVLAGA